MEIAGQTINGAQNIFFAQLADPNTTKFSVDATRFMAGNFVYDVRFAWCGTCNVQMCQKRKEKSCRRTFAFGGIDGIFDRHNRAA